MNIEIIEHVNLDEYVYHEDVEIFARVIIDGVRTKYAVSDHGRVWSEYRGGRFLSPKICRNGYVEFILCPSKAQGVIHPLGHRLVADVFCKKDDPNFVVDHIDHNRANNRANNLRWVSQSENVKRSFDEFQRAPSNIYEIFAYSILDKNVQYFGSIKDASVKLELDKNTISDVCNHRKNSCGGYIFGRAEEFDKDRLDKMLADARFLNTGRPVIHILQDGAVERYLSVGDASKKTGIRSQTICRWVNGKRIPSDGSTWKYADGPFVPRRMSL